MTDFIEVKKACVDAIRSDVKSRNTWVNAGAMVAKYYESEAAMVEHKAAFIEGAIIPALHLSHQTALAKALPRKGTKDYDALGEGGKTQWEADNQAKKDARAVAHTYFARILSYAFPKEKQAAVPRDLKTRLNEELSALVKACQKAEEPPFDPVVVIKHMEAALSAVNK